MNGNVVSCGEYGSDSRKVNGLDGRGRLEEPRREAEVPFCGPFELEC